MLFHMESFAEPCVTGNVVIPAKAGIQCYQVLSGFRVKSGMTGGGIIQRFHTKKSSCGQGHFHEITDNLLCLGQVLILPAGCLQKVTCQI